MDFPGTNLWIKVCHFEANVQEGGLGVSRSPAPTNHYSVIEARTRYPDGEYLADGGMLSVERNRFLSLLHESQIEMPESR